MSKSYVMAVAANELVSADKAGIDALIASNPDAYAEGTIIKIVTGNDEPPTVGDDTRLYVVLADKTADFANLVSA